MILYCYLTLLILFPLFRNSRTLEILSLVFLTIVMGANSMNCDLQYTSAGQSTDVYYHLYTDQSFFTDDIGYGILMVIFRSIGFTYKYFRLTLSVFEFSILYLLLKRFSYNRTLFFILYAIYPFCYDVAAQRNTLGMFIWFYAFSILVEGKSGHLIKYVILTIVAATMQKTYLIYVPLVFFWGQQQKYFYPQKLKYLSIVRNNVRYGVIRTLILLSIVIRQQQKYFYPQKLKYLLIVRNNVRYGVLCTLILLSIIIGLNRELLESITTGAINSILKDDRRGSIFENTTKIFWIVLWAEQIMNFVLVKYMGNKLMEKKETPMVYAYYKSVYILNIYGFLFLPLYVLAGVFFRLSKNIVPLNLIVFANYFYRFPRNPLILVVFLYQFFLFVLHIYLGGNWLMPFFEPIIDNNWIFGIGEKAL